MDVYALLAAFSLLGELEEDEDEEVGEKFIPASSGESVAVFCPLRLFLHTGHVSCWRKQRQVRPRSGISRTLLHLNRFLTTALSFYRAYCKHAGCTHLLQPRYDTVIVKQVIAGQLSDALLHAVVLFAYWTL